MWEVQPGVAPWPWPAGTSRPALIGLSARDQKAKTPKEEGRLKEIMSRESSQPLIGFETCAGMTVAVSGSCTVQALSFYDIDRGWGPVAPVANRFF